MPDGQINNPMYMTRIHPSNYDALMELQNKSFVILKNQIDSYTPNVDFLLKKVGIMNENSPPSFIQQLMNNCYNLSNLRLKYYTYHDLLSFAWFQ